MKCQKCGEREATTHVKKVINGYKQEYYLCADCAQEAGLMNFQNMDFGIGNFLSGIFGGDKKLQRRRAGNFKRGQRLSDLWHADPGVLRRRQTGLQRLL